MRRDEMVVQTRICLDEPTEDFFLDTEIVGWLIEGQNEFVIRTKFLEERASTDIVEGVSRYDIPEDSLLIVRVELDGKKIEEGSWPELDEYMDADEVAASIETKYLVWAGKMYIWPTPTSTVEDDLWCYYLRRPATLDDDGTISEVPVEYHRAVCWYAAAQGKLKDGEEQEAAMYEGKFDKKVSEFRRQKKKTSDGTAQVRDTEFVD